MDIDGDASFSMTAMELATASQYNIGVKVIVLNNEFQGMVLQWQGKYAPVISHYCWVFMLALLDLFYNARYSHTRMTNPDFIALAKAMGVHAIRAHTSAELPEKMKELMEYDNSKPVLLECLVESAEHVFPMVGRSYGEPIFFKPRLINALQVPAGKALHEQLLHPTLRDAYDAANKKT